MNRKFISLLSAIAVINFAAVAEAQTPAVSAKRAVEQSVGPTVSASVAGIRAPTSVRSARSRRGRLSLKKHRCSLDSMC